MKVSPGSTQVAPTGFSCGPQKIWSVPVWFSFPRITLFYLKRALSSFVKCLKSKFFHPIPTKKAESIRFHPGRRMEICRCCVWAISGVSSCWEVELGGELCGEVKLLFKINSAVPPVPPPPFKLSLKVLGRRSRRERLCFKLFRRSRGVAGDLGEHKCSLFFVSRQTLSDAPA